MISRSWVPKAAASSWAKVNVASSWSPCRAGDEVVIPEYAELSLPSLDANLVAEPSRGVSVDFARTQELDKPLFQRASQVVAKLGKILMPPFAGVRASRQVALRHDLSLVEPLQDDQFGVVPVGVPLAVVQQVVLAVRRDQLKELTLRRGVECEIGKRRIVQLGHKPGAGAGAPSTCS